MRYTLINKQTQLKGAEGTYDLFSPNHYVYNSNIDAGVKDDINVDVSFTTYKRMISERKNPLKYNAFIIKMFSLHQK